MTTLGFTSKNMNDITLVVTTSDGYTSLIDGFVLFFNKFYPNSKLNVYFALESIEIESYSNFHFITTYKKKWSERLHFVLNIIQSKFVYIIPEDFYIMHEINLEGFQDLLNFAINRKIDFLCPLFSQNNTRYELSSNGIDYYSVDKTWIKSYTILFAASGIYNRIFLMKLLRKNENIWEFENNAGYRVNQLQVNNYRYKTVKDPLAIYPPGIIFRGKLTKEGTHFLKKHNYNIKWKQQKRKVTTEEDSKILRYTRIPFRILKRIINISFNKF